MGEDTGIRRMAAALNNNAFFKWTTAFLGGAVLMMLSAYFSFVPQSVTRGEMERHVEKEIQQEIKPVDQRLERLEGDVNDIQDLLRAQVGEQRRYYELLLEELRRK